MVIELTVGELKKDFIVKDPGHYPMFRDLKIANWEATWTDTDPGPTVIYFMTEDEQLYRVENDNPKLLELTEHVCEYLDKVLHEDDVFFTNTCAKYERERNA